MSIFYQDPYVQIINGDCREVLAGLPSESVQCMVTSPPYWGLRKYHGEQDLIWGGDSNCQHQWIMETKKAMSQIPGDPEFERPWREQYSANLEYQVGFCALCGAWKGAYGLEPTPEMYIEHTIEILRLIRRVLRNDGVVFWNIGDSYATSPPGTKGGAMRWQHGEKAESVHDTTEYRSTITGGLKPKDLCLIPFRVAIAAQEDGWWVRSVIIWSKPNPMPESVTDRPTENHDYILMLTKSARYYWDADAVREPQVDISQCRSKSVQATVPPDVKTDRRSGFEYYGRYAEVPGGRNLRSVWEFPTEASGLEMCLKCKTVYDSAAYRKLPEKAISKNRRVDKEARDRPLESPIHLYRGDGWGEQAIEGRGEEIKVKICRCGASDWLSHFAVFPEKLPEICIKAATPEVGCCSMCGAPYERIRKPSKEYAKALEQARQSGDWFIRPTKEGYETSHKHSFQKPSEYKTLGWQPTCNCGAEVVPSLVLDPLAGSGRTGEVAKSLGRKAILIDTSDDYCRLAKRRIEVVALPMILPVEEIYPEAPDWF